MSVCFQNGGWYTTLFGGIKTYLWWPLAECTCCVGVHTQSWLKPCFGCTCESVLRRWQNCFLFLFRKCVYLYVAAFFFRVYGCECGCNSTGCQWALVLVCVWQPGPTWCKRSGRRWRRQQPAAWEQETHSSAHTHTHDLGCGQMTILATMALSWHIHFVRIKTIL